jgi:hypothetical protein
MAAMDRAAAREPEAAPGESARRGGWARAAGRPGRALAAGRAALAAALCLGAAGCAGVHLGPGAVLIPDEPPRVEPPAPQVRRPTAVVPGALPPGARAQLPALDGDPFVVTWSAKPAAEVTARQVLETLVEPVLRAIGFRHGAAALSLPPERGVPQPRADARRLARALAREYARRWPPPGPTTRDALDVLGGPKPGGDELDRRVRAMEGGTLGDLRRAVERQQIHYPFRQMVDGVVVDNVALVASRAEGQAVTSLAGALLDSYTVANARTLDAPRAVAAAGRTLRALGLQPAAGEGRPPAPEPVLLPYGTDAGGVTQLRHAHRARLRLAYQGRPLEALVWIDAGTGAVLKLEPYLRKAAPAVGRTWDRDPGVGTATADFDVDAAQGGQYVLRLQDVATRLDYQGDGQVGFDAADVAVPDAVSGVVSPTALFDQAPINEAEAALCRKGGNTAFQQVSLFATAARHRDTLIASGMFTPYPDPFLVWTPRVESAAIGCNAWSNLEFGACEGYRSDDCPDHVDGVDPDGLGSLMNFAHDGTMIAHELGHSATWRLTTARPPGWCGEEVCPTPLGLGQFHDIADFWAAHLEGTNCVGGWVAKNVGGANASLYCASHRVTGLPRLHRARVPFDPARPPEDADDHFPEHRGISTTDYADGQIAAAALWHVRLGMQSRAPVGGVPLYSAWVVQGLRLPGILGITPGTSDLDVYLRLHDLAARLMDQWEGGGAWAHTANKLQAGLARAGLFLIPPDCLDGSAATSANCGSKDNGGDAVVDVGDDDPSDDPHGPGVEYPESDFLRAHGPAPIFHVWTGPRYRLSGKGGASSLKSAPCNVKFQVEVSTDETFPPPSTIASGWITVDTDPRTPASPECYGRWRLGSEDWTTLSDLGAGTRLYYRARTRNSTNGNERLSTLPGNGAWQVPPPSAVITATGRPEP